MHEKENYIKICIHIHGLAMQDMARKAKLALMKTCAGQGRLNGTRNFCHLNLWIEGNISVCS